ncbi:MAG: tetratricopeptide repeat protein [Acidobacteria bacterium]|nr:tetratricopeptide repeat protein [Acidobacteriota bacterium]MCB9399296.1 tetratricopeptide repeat protein [Acidobacteriota bacterium]
MGESERKQNFWLGLLERRVPQILGIFLTVGWGLIQFFEWLVVRFDLPKSLPSTVFLLLLSLIPSVITIAYVRGHNFWGKRWTWVETAGIIANLVLAVSLLTTFSNKSKVENKPIALAESPISAQKVYRKKFFAIPFEVEGEVPPWLRSGMAWMTSFDLSQSLGVEGAAYLQSGRTKEYQAKLGVEHLETAQLTFWREIALKGHFPRLLTGTMSRSETGLFRLHFKVLDSDSLQPNLAFDLEGESPFDLVDLASARLLQEWQVPLDDNPNLPISEVFTASESAAENFMAGVQAYTFQGMSQAVPHFKKVLELDPNCTVAHLMLGITFANANMSVPSQHHLEMAMQRISSLPEPSQFQLKSLYYLLNGEGEKRIDLYRAHLELVPDDRDSRVEYARMLVSRNLMSEAIAEYERVESELEEPADLWPELARIYNDMGEFDRALSYHNRYLEKFPKEPEAYVRLANFQRGRGQLDAAYATLDKCSLLYPGNLDVLGQMADLSARMGQWSQAEKLYTRLIQRSQTDPEKFTAHRLSALYWFNRGKLDQSYADLNQARELFAQFGPPLGVAINDVFWVGMYARGGRVEEAKTILKRLEGTMEPPFDTLIPMGYCNFYIHMEDYDQAKDFLLKAQPAIQQFGDSFPVFRSYGLYLQAEVARGQKEYQTAIDLFEQYQKGSNQFFPVHYGLGMACYEKGDYEKALQVLAAGLAEDPFDANLNLVKTKTYMALKNWQEAQKALSLCQETLAPASASYSLKIKVDQLAGELSSVVR